MQYISTILDIVHACVTECGDFFKVNQTCLQNFVKSPKAIKYGAHTLEWDITTAMFQPLFSEIYWKTQDGMYLNLYWNQGYMVHMNGGLTSLFRSEFSS